jgi:hypothetical protein
MLETLRAYGARMLAEAGEEQDAAGALARYAVEVAGQAAAGLQTNGPQEVAAARWLDAEDAMMRQVLAWVAEHDPAAAARLAAALGWWWRLRGRLASQYRLLGEITARAETGSDDWCAAQLWLSLAAAYRGEQAAVLEQSTALAGAAAGRGPCRALADGLTARAIALVTLGRAAEAADDARRALAVAREIGDRTAELYALGNSAVAARNGGDLETAVRSARQAAQITDGVPGVHVRWAGFVLTGTLVMAGDLAAAGEVCAAALARSRDAGHAGVQWMLLPWMATVDVHAGRARDAAAHLREGLQGALRAGTRGILLECLGCCGYLCAATGRPAEALTVWAAYTALAARYGGVDPAFGRYWAGPLRAARQELGPDRTRAAEDRGAAMNLATAAEYALMLTAPAAQIAAELYISVHTVCSHLDRIRDRTGCRRADLTRLALRYRVRRWCRGVRPQWNGHGR